MSFKHWRRQVSSRILPPIVWWLIKVMWKTCRVRVIFGEDHLRALLDSGEPFIPCYWHQQQIFCVRYLLDLAETHTALNLGYLISPSADGDMATSMFGNQGVHIIRGSATRGGAQALRDIYLAIRKQKISPIVTPDGPTGPIFQCKPGVAMLSQLSGAPLVPLAYSGSRLLQLRSWDRFMLPVPFSSIVIGIGQPLTIDKHSTEVHLSMACQEMNERLNSLSDECRTRTQALQDKG